MDLDEAIKISPCDVFGALRTGDQRASSSYVSLPLPLPQTLLILSAFPSLPFLLSLPCENIARR